MVMFPMGMLYALTTEICVFMININCNTVYYKKFDFREELHTWPLQIPLAIVLPTSSPSGSLGGSVSSSPPSQLQQLPTSPNDSIQSAPFLFSLIGGRRAHSEIVPSLPSPPIEHQSLPAVRTIQSAQSTLHSNVPLIRSPASSTEQLEEHGDIRILILRTDPSETPLKVTRILDSFALFESGTVRISYFLIRLMQLVS